MYLGFCGYFVFGGGCTAFAMAWGFDQHPVLNHFLIDFLPEDLQLSEETYRQDTKTVLLTVRDATRQLYNKDIIRKKALEIERAGDTAVDFEAELKKLVKNNKILKNEEVAIQKILMDHNPEDGLQGSPSLLNLTQALTAYGRNQNSARTRDFAEIAGELMDRVKQ
jgi:hypothetical protein